MQTRRGFTIVEILVTLGIIGVLAALLLPALGVVRGTANMAKSQTNMRQTFALMRDYAVANRDTVLPSMFDFSETSVTPVQGKVRSDSRIAADRRFCGTWADILWTQAGFGPLIIPVKVGSDVQEVNDYRTYAPDSRFFALGREDKAPFRAAVPAGRIFGEDRTGWNPANPLGVQVSADDVINKNYFNSRPNSVMEPDMFAAPDPRTEPGMFAANNFFDSRPPLMPASAGSGGPTKPQGGRSKTNSAFDARTDLSTASGTYFNFGQILVPEASAYLIDSVAASTIDPVDPDSGDVRPFDAEDPSICQVAFRYPGDTCCILLLDGHVRSEQRWDELTDLEGLGNVRKSDGTLEYGTDPVKRADSGRGIRFRHLDVR